MNKIILKNALVHAHPAAVASVLNHFGIGIEWFNRPLKQPEELVKWASVLITGKHPRQTLTNEDKREIVTKLKEIYRYVNESLYIHLDKYQTKVRDSARIDDGDIYDYLAESYREMRCPHCDNSEKFDLNGCIHDWEHFEPIGSEYFKCGSCSKALRYNEWMTDISSMNFEGEFMVMGEMQHENVMSLLATYCDDMEEKGFNAFRIEGRNLNWRGSNGYAEVGTDPKELFEKLTINSDYTLEVDRMFDDTLEVSLSHHDANSGFTVKPGVRCEFNEDVLVGEEIELARAYAAIASLLGIYYYEYISEDAYIEQLEGFTQDMNETVAEIFEELGTNITYTLAENLMKLDEEVQE